MIDDTDSQLHNGSLSTGRNSGTHPLQRSETTEEIRVVYQHCFSLADPNGNDLTPICQEKRIVTSKQVPKIGVMLVGLGGNNGSTFVAGILANKHQLSWQSRLGTQTANFYGSFTQSATAHVAARPVHAASRMDAVAQELFCHLHVMNAGNG